MSLVFSESTFPSFLSFLPLIFRQVRRLASGSYHDILESGKLNRSSRFFQAVPVGGNMTRVPLLVAIMVIVAAPVLADLDTVSCSGVKITRETDPAPNLQDICPALAHGKEILAGMGLKLPASLQISFKQKPYTDEICRARCIGYYDGRTKKLYLPGYKSVRQIPQESSLFNGEITSEIWESYLVHELAHVAVQQTAGAGKPLCIASEYIAAVAQILALSADDRNTLLKQYGLTGFSGDRDITLTYYLIDPGKFAVNSYLHYRKLADGPAYVRQILSNDLSCDD